VFVTLFAHDSLGGINATIGQFHQDGEWMAIEKQTEADRTLRSGDATSYQLTPVSFSPLK
jgi:hypothetical protein